jgi:hypothetical protein
MAGLGDASSIETVDQKVVLLWAVKGPYLVSVEVSLDNPPNEVTGDDLAPVVQAVLDNLAAIPLTRPTSQPVSTGDSGCDAATAAAISDQLRPSPACRSSAGATMSRSKPASRTRGSRP